MISRLVNQLIEGKPEKSRVLAVVTAQAFDRKTGRPVGAARDEVINLATNRLFKGCETWVDVKKAYEAFWNDLNPLSEEMVIVSAVKMDDGDAREFRADINDKLSEQKQARKHYGKFQVGPQKRRHSVMKLSPSGKRSFGNVEIKHDKNVRIEALLGEDVG